MRLRKLGETGFRGPPVVVAHVGELRRTDAGKLVGSAAHRPTLVRIVVLERQWVLAIPDVLRDDIDAAPDAHRKVVELEARVRFVQCELYGLIVNFRNAGDPVLHVGRADQIWRVAQQHLNAEHHVVGGVRYTVAPGDAVAKLECPGVLGRVRRHALADPALNLAGLVIEHEQRLEDGLVIAHVQAAARQVGIPYVGRQVAPAIDVKDECLGSVDRLTRGSRRRCNGLHRREQQQKSRRQRTASQELESSRHERK